METNTGKERRILYNSNQKYRDFVFQKNPNPMRPKFAENLKNANTNDIPSIHHESVFIHHRNLKFHLKKWRLKNEEIKPKAVVFFIHGYGGGVIFNTSLILENLARENFVAIGMDGFGHGLSDGLHAYIPSFELYVDDYATIYKKVSSEYPGLKKFLLCNSMGGAVGLHLLASQKEREYDGIVLLSPMLGLADGMKPNFIEKAALSFAAFILPTSKLTPVKKDISIAGSNNEEMAEYIKSNPLLYNNPDRLKTSYELIRVCENIESIYPKIKTHLLILHGDVDPITSCTASKVLFEKGKMAHKEIKIYKDQRHTLLFDEKAEEVFNDIILWINNRIGHCDDS